MMRTTPLETAAPRGRRRGVRARQATGRWTKRAWDVWVEASMTWALTEPTIASVVIAQSALWSEDEAAWPPDARRRQADDSPGASGPCGERAPIA